MSEEEWTVFHNLLYLLRSVPGSREISYIRTHFHPLVQIWHFLDAGSATGMPVIQDKRLSKYICLRPDTACGIRYFKVRKRLSHPFIKGNRIAGYAYHRFCSRTGNSQKFFPSGYFFYRNPIFDSVLRQRFSLRQPNLQSHVPFVIF